MTPQIIELSPQMTEQSIGRKLLYLVDRQNLLSVEDIFESKTITFLQSKEEVLNHTFPFHFVLK